jgi:hypothetical protein
MNKPITHLLADVLAAGYVESSAPACAQLVGLGYLVKYQAHCAIRLSDGLWHCFRYADADKAREMDAALRGPLL